MRKFLSKTYIIFDKFRKRKLSKLKFQDREANNKVVEGLKEVLKEADISSGSRRKIGVFYVNRHSKEYSGRGNRDKVLRARFFSGKSVSVHKKSG